MITRPELKCVADFINTKPDWEATLIDSGGFMSWLQKKYTQEEINNQFTEAIIEAIKQGKAMPFTIG